jgi:2-polyprenyl-3-methyl-5-hydroxy-6-metoxy-1,4-benzoquinol methylase
VKYATELTTQRYPWKEIPGSSHQVLMRRILAMKDGLRVLDLGFGAGLLARRIRHRCRFLAGIELDPQAAREGAPFFDAPFVGDLLAGLKGPWDEPFDVVVAGDILEHLPDPEVTIDRLRPLVARDGVLLASLPNVANVSVRLALLAGRFEYADRGILDRTHLRFFTRRSARRLFETHGFRVARETPTAMPFELALPALTASPLGPVTRGAAVGLARLAPSLFGYQFVLEAVPA